MMIDGVQNTDMGSNGGVMTYPGLETLSEVKILSSNYSAEYGTAGSANTLVVTRAGTQQFHGAAYEYVRNDTFDARNFFAASKPPLRLNNFGYRIGGPVFIPRLYNTKRDKTFFFWSEEWRRRRSAQIVRAATPSNDMRSGDYSAEAVRLGKPILDPLSGQPFGGNIIPTSRINANAKILLGYLFPTPNASGFLNYIQNFSVPENFRENLIRIDHNFTDKLKVMFRFIDDSWVQTQPLTLWSGQSFPTISSVADIPGRNFVGKMTKIISPSVLTEVSFNYANNYGSREKNAVTLQGNFLQPPGLKLGRLFLYRRTARTRFPISRSPADGAASHLPTIRGGPTMISCRSATVRPRTGDATRCGSAASISSRVRPYNRRPTHLCRDRSASVEASLTIRRRTSCWARRPPMANWTSSASRATTITTSSCSSKTTGRRPTA